jgi:hypothetical protein
MSPAEAAAIIDEPDWIQRFWDCGSGEFAFELVLKEWRRWHWTPVMVNGVEKKNPASATEGIIALAEIGVTPPRSLPRSEGYQYDDHMFLMSEGREWRIVGVEDKTLILRSDGDEWQIDLSRAKWDKYVDAATAALAART